MTWGLLRNQCNVLKCVLSSSRIIFDRNLFSNVVGSNIPSGLFITVWWQKLQKFLCQRVSLVVLSEHLNPTAAGELAHRERSNSWCFLQGGKYIHHRVCKSSCNTGTITDASAWMDGNVQICKGGVGRGEAHHVLWSRNNLNIKMTLG